MSSIEIDPTFVLKYLNDLGYRNISAEQLKEFVRDLKKLIKYDKGQEQHHKENNKYFDYMNETVSSRAKRSKSTSAQQNIASSPLEEQDFRTNSVVSGYSKSTSALDKTGNSDTNWTSGNAACGDNVDRTNHVSRRRKRVSEPKDVMWIRTKSGTRVKKCDPVSLYQSYQNEWNRFKKQIPINNKHQDLRWNIRKKTMG